MRAYIKRLSSIIFIGAIASILFHSDCFATFSGTLNIDSGNIAPFSRNAIDIWSPCGAPVDCSSAGDGNYAAVLSAKNADKSFFNGQGDVPSMQWDTTPASMKQLLETYGDLAYQLGRAAGVPWIAVLAQAHFEDPQSVCGHNNFWGNGCDPSHAYPGGADLVIGEAKNLGEGFVKYGETVHNGLYEEALAKTDPVEYIRALEGTWIGTGSSYAIEGHIRALEAYIETAEGKAIVETFGSFGAGNCSGADVIYPLDEDSVNVPCANGTTDLGVHEGYYKGKKLNVRLCAVSSLDAPSSDDGNAVSNPKSKYYINGADGKAVVNSRVSGAYYALGKKIEQDGYKPYVGSSFRTNEQQKEAVEYWTAQGQPGRAAAPGRSNHQSGYAVDIGGGRLCGYGYPTKDCHTPFSDWLRDNLAEFDLTRTNAIESWHIAPVSQEDSKSTRHSYTPSGSSSDAGSSGNCSFTKYNYSDGDLKKLAAIAATENGDSIEALKNEMSLMANLFESNRGKGFSSVLDYVLNSGWFGGSKGSISGDSASSEQFEAAKDVFNNGNRTLPPEVDEHDCIDCGAYGFDITSIEVNGNTISDQAGLLKSSNYIKDKTVLHNRYGSTYTFYTWANPSNPVNSDPMGYTGGSVSCDPSGGSCTSSKNVVTEAVEEILQLANKNGSTYTPGGGHNSAEELDAMLNGAPVNVDCTGFSTLVMYKAFGVFAPHSSSSIISGSNSDQYEEIPRSEVGPGDVFAFHSSESWSGGHGGIVIEASNGQVTKVAESGAGPREGSSGSNTNIGYTSGSGYSIGYLNSDAAHFYRLKGAQNTSTACDQGCSRASDGDGSLVAGGMDYDKATEFIKPYVEEASKRFRGDYGGGYTNGTSIGSGWVVDAGCFDGTLNNCVAFSQWFINNYTTAGPTISTVNGWDYVDYLVNNGIFESGGKTPRAYAIFSTISYNHTGVVLGINEAKGEMYIGEASCSNGYKQGTSYDWPAIRVVPLDKATNGDYVYAYTDSKLKL